MTTDYSLSERIKEVRFFKGNGITKLFLNKTSGKPIELPIPSGSGGGTQNIIAPVAVVSHFHEVLSSPPSGAATIDGYVVQTGDRVLLNGQNVGVDNGVWIANTAGLWTRPNDWLVGTTILDGTLLSVSSKGNYLYSSIWILRQDAVVGTDEPVFIMLASSDSSSLEPQNGDDPSLIVGGKVRFYRQLTTNSNSMPTTNPHVVGELWNNAGVVNVSAG